MFGPISFVEIGECRNHPLRLQWEVQRAQPDKILESIWNVMAHGDAREGEWKGNWRMEWVASTLHTTSEHGVSSIPTADAPTSAASSRLNWRPRLFKWTRPFRRKTKSGFLRVYHHISNAVCASFCCKGHNATSRAAFCGIKAQGCSPASINWKPTVVMSFETSCKNSRICAATPLSAVWYLFGISYMLLKQFLRRDTDPVRFLSKPFASYDDRYRMCSTVYGRPAKHTTRR